MQMQMKGVSNFYQNLKCGEVSYVCQLDFILYSILNERVEETTFLHEEEHMLKLHMCAQFILHWVVY